MVQFLLGYYSVQFDYFSCLFFYGSVLGSKSAVSITVSENKALPLSDTWAVDYGANC